MIINNGFVFHTQNNIYTIIINNLINEILVTKIKGTLYYKLHTRKNVHLKYTLFSVK